MTSASTTKSRFCFSALPLIFSRGTLLLIAVSAVLQLGVCQALAESSAETEGKFELGGQLGMMIFEDESQLDPDLFAGGRFGYFFTNDIEGELSLLAGSVDVDNAVGFEGDADVIFTAAEVAYHFLPGNVRPFVEGGIGVVDIDGRPKDDGANLAFPFGGGVKWLISDELAARADARWIINSDGGRDLNEGALSLGLSWLFGGKQPEAAPLKVKPAPKAAPSAKVEPFAEESKVLKEKGSVSINLLVNFDTDKSEIKPQYQARLRDFATFLKKHPQAVAEIEGHTDNQGSAKYNLALSLRRAAAIRDYVISQGGGPISRMRARGYGFEKPVADNQTVSGRAENRRVIGTVRTK